jgi:acyl-CoA dehydrogenase
VPIYRAPVDEMMFLLTDVLKVGRFGNLPSFAEAPPDLMLAILREAAKLCEEVVQPLNRIGDQEGCTRHDDGSVTTPKGFKQAYRQCIDGGWIGISAPGEFGGQGLPGTLTVAIHEFMNAANLAFAMYSGLTQGALATILAHGTAEQKARYLPAMIAGRCRARGLDQSAYAADTASDFDLLKSGSDECFDDGGQPGFVAQSQRCL